MSKIDGYMGKGGLMDWPGKSRSKFASKLRSRLKIRCIDSKSRCDPTGKKTLRGRVVPILHQRRIALCTNNIANTSSKTGESQIALYIGVLAHEVAHEVRLNSHRKSCKKKYTQPRFSQSVGLAAKHAALKVPYKASDYTKNC